MENLCLNGRWADRLGGVCVVLALSLFFVMPVRLAHAQPSQNSSEEIFVASPAAVQTEVVPDWNLPALHSAGLLLVLRLGCSALWSDHFDVSQVDQNAQIFRTSWSEAPQFDSKAGFFEWDHDPWAINLFGHGLMGSEHYFVYRRSGHPWWTALGMTVAWTLIWEYLVEAWHKHPSGLDLVWTPVGGALIGEGRFLLYKRILRMHPSVGRHALLYLMDPIGQLERDVLGLDY